MNTPRILIAAVTVFVLAACGTPAAEPAPSPLPDHIIRGQLRLPGGNTTVDEDGAPCWSGRYDDIEEGAQVVVTDESGETIGVGKLQEGFVEVPKGFDFAARDCVFKFVVRGVPRDREFYGIEVTHRGVVQIPAPQITEYVELTLD